ncbi:polyketide cyclase/dehydrase/lipid transport protein [Kitasatospora sp. SolWspMP-SS2h]|uniref:SRPBCC family protein n=1 Tax=Kitasatospora sp. SolWspMP-SS2h TaxID=1305729 RepID=UPI000DBAB779|nr:SRPBCC family protein [Kitasatospora sp. SolWspMP-SS2h]RAJ44093.1 polyketide cyclase/dehydrase/lipid transport protein [Kitasatospora sp. SolWspMP-SS2h]
MGKVHATTERTYGADPARVYEALADYAVTRPKLLPAQYSEYEVRSGGRGAGTQVHWKLQATEKRVRDCLFTVSAPGPETLVETDANSSMVITWTVSPDGGSGSRVTVEASWTGATGIGGFFERTFAPKGLNRIHDQVLANLAAELG